MGANELELRCPQNVNGIAADPHLDWSFDKLRWELNSIHLDSPSPFIKTEPIELEVSRNKRGFIMHVSDDETDSLDSNSDVEADNSVVVPGRRFACDELYMSDDSENGITLGEQWHQLMDKVTSAEDAVDELTNGSQLSITEEVRSKVSYLEIELVNENEKFCSLTTKIDEDGELQQEMERILDLQYERKIAEALDNYLTAIQRDHEHISQFEERRIRDMAHVEARRREREIQEEKLRQENIRAEKEAKLKVEMAERAIEAEEKSADEIAANHDPDTLDTTHNAGKDSKETPGLSSSIFDVNKAVESSVSNIIRASENALELEKRRKQIYEELSAKNKALKENANQDYRSHGHTIGRQFKTITATRDRIRTKAEELMKLLNSPECPQSISIELFAEKIVANCTNHNAIFAASGGVVILTSKIPLAMDILIAELNKVCIYTVPKSYSEEAFKTKDDYFKAIGYEEVDGKIEGINDYQERLRRYMEFYGALVQTEVEGVENLHGLTEGWAWLARFLNTLPANLYTATALDSFLKMAGYALYCRYKNQFEKLLSIVARDFIGALQDGGSAKIIRVKISIKDYIELMRYKDRPQGLGFRTHLDSNHLVIHNSSSTHNYYG